MITQGPRWQYYPVLAAGVVGILTSTRTRTRRLARWAGNGLGVGLLVVGALALWGFRPLHLPDPGGSYPVGTTVAYWTDDSRPETATADPDDRRQVVAQIWYPAARRGEPASYLGRRPHEVARGLAGTFGVPAFLFSEAARGRTHSTLDAEPVKNTGVVLFSPGLESIRTQNTAWAEYLAARGYVVVALDHPYDSAVTVLEDGTTIRSTATSTGDDAKDNADADRLTAIRAADLSFALDRIEALPQFASDQVTVAGHSAGGAAALLAAAQDRRFRAAIDIDGLPRNDPHPTQPVLALVAGDQTGNTEYLGKLREVTDNIQVVEGSKHLSFTDAPYLLPPVPALIGTTDANPATTRATLSFLRAHERP